MSWRLLNAVDDPALTVPELPKPVVHGDGGNWCKKWEWTRLSSE